MNAIVPFNFGEHPVRIENREGAPWFVLADVCRVLGMSNPSMAAQRLDDDERDDLSITDPIGRPQTATVVNEAGLYRLILTSRKESAKRFSRWLTHEVLPSIRRTGAYGAPAQALDLDDAATLHRLLLDHTGRTMSLEQRIGELEPKAEAFERLAEAPGTLTFTSAAKVLKIGRDELIRWMNQHGWIYRASTGQWLGYRTKEQTGLIEHVSGKVRDGPKAGTIVPRAHITAKGLAMLAELIATPQSRR